MVFTGSVILGLILVKEIAMTTIVLIVIALGIGHLHGAKKLKSTVLRGIELIKSGIVKIRNLIKSLRK